MTDIIKFSILVPVYKVEEYIRQCVDSVLSQSYTNFELILVDDGSPDSCGEICDDYAAKDERVRVFHKPNGGLFHTRRVALEKVTGDYVLFVDSDDYIAENTLEILAQCIETHDPDCLMFGVKWMRPDRAVDILCSGHFTGRLITNKREVLNLAMNDASYNSLCRKCVKVSCFDGRDFSGCYHIKSGEDRVQSEEIWENAKSFFFLPQPLYFYRVNQESITHSIIYDGYDPDFTVELRSLAMLRKLDVFVQEDYDRFRNSMLDALIIDLKRVCRFCSDRNISLNVMNKIRNCGFYQEYLIDGYRNCPSIPGVYESRGIRRRLNAAIAALFKAKKYSVIFFICKHIYKSA